MEDVYITMDGGVIGQIVQLPTWFMWVAGATLVASLLSLAIMSYLSWCWWQAGR